MLLFVLKLCPKIQILHGSDLVGFATPVYLSFKSLSRDDQVGINQWLSYWTVYGFIIVAESFFFLSSLYVNESPAYVVDIFACTIVL